MNKSFHILPKNCLNVNMSDYNYYNSGKIALSIYFYLFGPDDRFRGQGLYLYGKNVLKFLQQLKHKLIEYQGGVQYLEIFKIGNVSCFVYKWSDNQCNIRISAVCTVERSYNSYDYSCNHIINNKEIPSILSSIDEVITVYNKESVELIKRIKAENIEIATKIDEIAEKEVIEIQKRTAIQIEKIRSNAKQQVELLYAKEENKIKKMQTELEEQCKLIKEILDD